MFGCKNGCKTWRKNEWVLAVFVLMGVTNSSIAQDENDKNMAENKVVLLATTTSTENSGLLNYILPVLEADTGYSVRVIAAGTGKALKMGEAGDVDVVMVHAKESELAFVQAGHGIDRKEVMYNDFVVIGPTEGPVSTQTRTSVEKVFQEIAANSFPFVSRGDDSGTHKKELQIWQAAGISPTGAWYREVGQGMGKTLQIASELGAYALTDRGTWIFASPRLSLKIIAEYDPRLNNQYSVIAVNPKRHDINHVGVTAFIQWMTSDKGQRLINQYRIQGKQLFYANAH